MQQFFEEFPWLEKHVTKMEKRTGVEIIYATVQRMGRGLLRQRPLKSIDCYFLLLDSRGEKICEVGAPLPSQKRRSGGEPKIDEGKSVLETIVNLGQQKEGVHYVLAFCSCWLHVNKPPKTLTLMDLIAKQRATTEEAEVEVKGTCEGGVVE